MNDREMVAKYEANLRISDDCFDRTKKFLGKLKDDNNRQPTVEELPQALSDLLGSLFTNKEHQELWLNSKNESMWGDFTPQQIIDQGRGMAIWTAMLNVYYGMPS